MDHPGAGAETGPSGKGMEKGKHHSSVASELVGTPSVERVCMIPRFTDCRALTGCYAETMPSLPSQRASIAKAAKADLSSPKENQPRR
jgi:hypothetical protein